LDIAMVPWRCVLRVVMLVLRPQFMCVTRSVSCRPCMASLALPSSAARWFLEAATACSRPHKRPADASSFTGSISKLWNTPRPLSPPLIRLLRVKSMARWSWQLVSMSSYPMTRFGRRAVMRPRRLRAHLSTACSRTSGRSYVPPSDCHPSNRALPADLDLTGPLTSPRRQSSSASGQTT
jgi:hypothetical protein